MRIILLVLILTQLHSTLGKVRAQSRIGKSDGAGHYFRQPRNSTATTMAFLNRNLDMTNFRNPMTLKEALGALYEFAASKNFELPILVDADAFHALDPDSLENVFESQVRFPWAQQMPITHALRLALAKVKHKATFLIRNGVVEIVPAQHATTEKLLESPVVASFASEPLEEVIEQLADQHGLSMIVDPRIQERAHIKIAASFANDVTLRGALNATTRMAGIDWVAMPHGGVVVTTTEHANRLRSQQAKRDRNGEERQTK